MNKKNCKEALEIYKKFLERTDNVSAFLKVAEVSAGRLVGLAIERGFNTCVIFPVVRHGQERYSRLDQGAEQLVGGA